ncbi:MAG TPA: response regulator transcription factor [bacterium]|nr:response regulator transcription factor [bacterium]
MARAVILVIEDDPDIRELLVYALGKEGYQTLEAASGEAGLKQVKENPPDLVILDIMLPGIDGLEVLRKLKHDQKLRPIPVLIASARGEETDIVAGLELGADDYVTKPFSPRVLVARVRTALRRASEAAAPQSDESPILTIHDFVLDVPRHELMLGGRAIDLSATEFAILEHLARSPGRVFTRTQMIDAIRGHDYPVTDRSIDVQVLGIRKKLGDRADLLETVRGVGYRFRDEQ